MELNGHLVTSTTLPETLAAAAAGKNAQRGLTIGGEFVSYADLNRLANRLAHGLAASGLGRGDVVATFMLNSAEHVAAWFAATKLGAIWAPINTSLKSFDLSRTLAHARPRAVLIDSSLARVYLEARSELDAVPELEIVAAQLPGADGDVLCALQEILSEETADPEVVVDPIETTAIIFTGGSTGMPKGVMVSHLWFVAAALRYRELFEPTENDVHVGVGQMCHAIGSAIDVFCPMYYGLSASLPRQFSADGFWERVRSSGGTIIGCLIGPLIARLCSAPPGPQDRDHNIRIATSGTAQIPLSTVEEFERRFGIELLELYAQTESGALGVTAQRRDDRPYYSQGRPHGWGEVMIGDIHGQPCPPNVVGEILLRPTVPYTFMLGYFKAPEKYAEATANLWFHTGDVGYLDERGYLFFTGRLAHAIRVRGENVSAFEIEQAAKQHESVEECAAVGVGSERGEEDVRMFVQVAQGHEFDPKDLVEFLRERIAHFKVPRFIDQISEWPRSAVKGEIERHVLRERSLAGSWDRRAAGVGLRSE